PRVDASPPLVGGTLDTPVAVSSEVAAAALGTDVPRVEATRAAIELLYQRRYKEARKAFDALTARYPTSGIGPLGAALIWQGLMFENFDFRYEGQYRVAYDAARAQLAAGAKEPGNDALEAFIGAGLQGLDAIWALRKGEVLTALDRAISGMRGLERTKALAPAFKDALLGDGMYLYWRSVVTRSSRLLPDFPDRRAEGLALMKRAEAESVFLGAGASLSLAYAYIEERQLAHALDRSLAIRMRYADNVMNNMTLGRVYTSLRRYDDALRVYDEVLADEPKNQRVHYFRGVVLARTGRYAEAARAYHHYVGFREVPGPLRSQAWYRLGTVYEQLGDPRRAHAAFEQAVATGGNEAARRALDRMKKGKR
ncbi:MAG: tetratricopeptide repeat protein, partial [Myxococcota bacterium]